MAMRMDVPNRAPHLAWARAGRQAPVPRPGSAQGRSGRDGTRPVQLLLPGERMADDQIDIVEPGLPAEDGADAAGLGDDFRRVAGPARREAHGEIATRHAPHGFDHVHHREAAAVAAVEYEAVAAGAQVLERVEVGGDEIADV